MFRLDERLKVYLHREPVDFRLNINGLTLCVEQALGLDPFAACARRVISSLKTVAMLDMGRSVQHAERGCLYTQTDMLLFRTTDLARRSSKPATRSTKRGVLRRC